MESPQTILRHFSADERASLRGLLPTMMKARVPEEHERKFISLDLVEAKLGGLSLTFLGERVARSA